MAAIARQRSCPTTLVAAGGALVLFCMLLVILSPRFDTAIPMEDRPILLVVTLLVCAGAVYLAVAGWALKRGLEVSLPLIVLLGLFMRIPLFWSTPILEDDYHRYLWDGGLSRYGQNPFVVTPNDARKDAASFSDGLRRATLAGNDTLLKVNHSALATIYPVTAQAAFLGAHLLRPWSLTGWRIVLLLCDGVSVWLLIRLLGTIRKPQSWALLYWWNPLLVKEVYNSAHMEPVVICCLLFALLFWTQRRFLWTGAALGLAVGAKIWPLMLAPVLAARWGWRSRETMGLTVTLAAVSLLALSPALLALGHADRSGLASFSQTWEMNDAFYMLVFNGWRYLGWDFTDAHRLARLCLLPILLVMALWAARVPRNDLSATLGRAGLLVAVFFMLSPAQFPWYFLWMLPFLTLHPVLPLLGLTVTLPLYYLRFHYTARDQEAFFDSTVVWLEYVPIWIWWGFAWIRKRQKEGN